MISQSFSRSLSTRVWHIRNVCRASRHIRTSSSPIPIAGGSRTERTLHRAFFRRNSGRTRALEARQQPPAETFRRGLLAVVRSALLALAIDVAALAQKVHLLRD